MRFKLGLAIGAGAGYLVGSGKGRELATSMKRWWDNAGTGSASTSTGAMPTPMGTDDEIARRLAS